MSKTLGGAPIPTRLPQHILAWLTGKSGLPANTIANFTSGGAEAYVSAATEGLWLHTDATWGGAAILSPRLRRYLGGIEAADSITCDAHKWFSVPMGAGVLCCRHPDAVRTAFCGKAMPRQTAGPVVAPYTTLPQWFRRFIGLELFLTLAY